MVISTENQVTYNGDGTNKAWPFTFQTIDKSDVKLMLIYENGTRVEIDSDYYVDSVNNTVYYPGYAPGAEPPEEDQPPKVQAGQKLMVYRQLPLTQEADLGESWPFSVIEKGLDKLTMLVQDVYGWYNRNIMKYKEGALAWDGEHYRIVDVENPIDEQDVANKQYVDNIIAGIVAAGNDVIVVDNVAAMIATDLQDGMFCATGGYNNVNDGGHGLYRIRAKQVIDVEDGGSIIFMTANDNVAELITDGKVSVKQFGAVGDNDNDDTTLIQNAIDYAESVGGCTVYFPKGNYKITDTINVNDSNVKLQGEGKHLSVICPTPDLIIDADNLDVNWSIYVKNNNPTVVTSPSAKVNYKSDTISVTDATGIEAGMLLYMEGDFSTSPWTSNNRDTAVKGETNKVLSVSGTTVTLATPTSEVFDPTDLVTPEIVTLTFVKPLTGIVISELGVTCPDNCPEDERQYRGFCVEGCDGALITDCYGNGCGMSCFESIGSFMSKLHNNIVNDCWAYYPNTTNIYALCYGLRCSKDNLSEITNNQGRECRHCVDISGGYPSHGIRVADNVFDSHISDYGVISTHGPAEGCVIENNVATGSGTSIMIRGERIVVRNNYCKGNVRNYYGRNNTYENNTVFGVFVFYQEDTIEDTNYTIIRNNSIYTMATLCVYLNGYDSVPFTTANGWVVEGNISIQESYASTTEKVKFFNIAYSGSASVTFQKGFIYKNNFTRSQKYNDVSSTPLIEDPTTATVGGTYDPVITDEFVINAAPARAIKGESCFVWSMKQPAWFDGERWIGADGRLATAKANAAPSDGTYKRGDIVYNSAPSAGGYVGWICVTAGTPGTWKGFGSIEA